MKTLAIRPLTAEAFAPYGWVAAAAGRAGRAINDGTTRRVDGTGALQLTADGDVIVLGRQGAAVDCDLAELPEPVTLQPGA